MNATATRKPRQLKPVTGSARWIDKPSGPSLWGRLAITNANGQTTEYDVQAFLEGERIVGFGLAKDDDEIYSIALTQFGWECSCPDANWNNRDCKHARALRAALAAVGITLAMPKSEAPKQPEAESCCNDCGRLARDCACFDDP